MDSGSIRALDISPIWARSRNAISDRIICCLEICQLSSIPTDFIANSELLHRLQRVKFICCSFPIDDDGLENLARFNGHTRSGSSALEDVVCGDGRGAGGGLK